MSFSCSCNWSEDQSYLQECLDNWQFSLSTSSFVLFLSFPTHPPFFFLSGYSSWSRFNFISLIYKRRTTHTSKPTFRPISAIDFSTKIAWRCRRFCRALVKSVWKRIRIFTQFKQFRLCHTCTGFLCSEGLFLWNTEFSLLSTSWSLCLRWVFSPSFQWEQKQADYSRNFLDLRLLKRWTKNFVSVWWLPNSCPYFL